MLTVTYRTDPKDESTRRTIEIPQAVDALGGQAVDEFVASYDTLRAAGETHEGAMRALLPELPTDA